MKIFNLYGDEWDEPRDREGWRIKEAFVGRRHEADHRESAEQRRADNQGRNRPPHIF
jgi:hypothetical protein